MSNDTQTLTLTDFLLARIAEDEAASDALVVAEVERCRADGLSDLTEQEVRDYWGDQHWWKRRLAECEAKRRVVKWVTGAQAAAGDPPGFDLEDAEALTHVLRLLALPHADHPDYSEDWRP